MLNKSAGVRNVLARRILKGGGALGAPSKDISDSSTFVYHAVALLLHTLPS